MTIACTDINDSTGICTTLEGTGAGIGVFVQYLGMALPSLLIILGVIGVVLAIGFAIASVIKKSIGNVRMR